MHLSCSGCVMLRVSAMWHLISIKWQWSMWHFGTKERPCVNCEGVSPTLIVKLIDFPQKALTFHCSTSLSFLSEARCWGGAGNLCIGDQDKCPDHIPQSCLNKFLCKTFLLPRTLDQEWNQWLHGVSSSSSFSRGEVGAVQQNLQPLAASLATKVFCKLQKSFVAVTGVSSPPSSLLTLHYNPSAGNFLRILKCFIAHSYLS